MRHGKSGKTVNRGTVNRGMTVINFLIHDIVHTSNSIQVLTNDKTNNQFLLLIEQYFESHNTDAHLDYTVVRIIELDIINGA